MTEYPTPGTDELMEIYKKCPNLASGLRAVWDAGFTEGEVFVAKQIPDLVKRVHEDAQKGRKKRTTRDV